MTDRRPWRAKGSGILLISSELPEILGLSDRIICMQHGRITGELVCVRSDRGARPSTLHGARTSSHRRFDQAEEISSVNEPHP